MINGFESYDIYGWSKPVAATQDWILRWQVSMQSSVRLKHAPAENKAPHWLAAAALLRPIFTIVVMETEDSTELESFIYSFSK